MPNVLRIGPYRFGFFSNENNEMAHVHVTRDQAQAKFWLEPSVSLCINVGFAAHELTRILALVVANEPKLKEAWDAHHKR
jgi:hypothetical protein